MSKLGTEKFSDSPNTAQWYWEKVVGLGLESRSLDSEYVCFVFFCLPCISVVSVFSKQPVKSWAIIFVF